MKYFICRIHLLNVDALFTSDLSKKIYIYFYRDDPQEYIIIR